MAENEGSVGASGWRARAAVLALGTFAVGTDGFIIVGLLPEIHTTLYVSISAAGQMVSVFSITYALLGPVLAALTGKWPRRTVLVTGIALLAVGNAVTASVRNFGLVLVARGLAGAGAALFAASSVATAAYLAGDKRRGSAIAMVTAGATLSLVLGAPLGTFIGGAWGWQAAIWLVAGVGALTAIVIGVMLPAIKLDQNATLRQRIAPLTDGRVLRILVVTLLAFIGVFLPFTYLSAVFAPATGGDQSRLALLLLVFGITATVGNLTAGSMSDRFDARRVVIAATLGLAIVCVLMILVRNVFLLGAIVVAFSGVFSYSIIGPQAYRIISYAPPGGASLVTSLNTSTAYLGQFLSGAFGAVILTGTDSITLLLSIAAVFAALAAFLTQWLSRRAGEQRGEADRVESSPAT